MFCDLPLVEARRNWSTPLDSNQHLRWEALRVDVASGGLSLGDSLSLIPRDPVAPRRGAKSRPERIAEYVVMSLRLSLSPFEIGYGVNTKSRTALPTFFSTTSPALACSRANLTAWPSFSILVSSAFFRGAGSAPDSFTVIH